MPPRYQSTLLSFEEKLRNLADLAGQPGHRAHARIGAGLNRGGSGQSLIELADYGAGETTGAAQLLVLSATGDSIASGGDYVNVSTVVAQHGFEGVAQPSDGYWVHPVAGIYLLTYEHTWDTYEGGGTISLELDGTVPPEGIIAAGSSGQSGRGTIAYAAQAGAVGRIKVTQSSGSAQTCDGTVWVAITDPTAEHVTDPTGGYRAAVLALGPEAYWRFGETSGTTARDETGNGLHGTYVGTVTFGVGSLVNDSDPSIDLGSGSPHVNLGSPAAFDVGTGDFTFKIWIGTDGEPVNEAIAAMRDAGTTLGWALVQTASHAVRLDVYTGSLTSITSSGITITDFPNGHMIAVTREAGVWTLYLDGVAQGTYNDGGAFSLSAAATLYVGVNYDGSSNQYTDVVDEAAFFSYALSAAEVADLYAEGSS